MELHGEQKDKNKDTVYVRKCVHYPCLQSTVVESDTNPTKVAIQFERKWPGNVAEIII